MNSTAGASLAARKTAARYAFVLAIFVCLAGGIYLTIVDPKSSLREKLSGLGINLVASAIFAVIFTRLSDRENRELLRTEISSHFDSHSHEVLERIESANRFFMPTATFAASEGFDKVFNSELMNAFEQSSIYYFRGPSAKYVPARIRASRRCPPAVRVYMPGPNATAAIRSRVADRLKNPKYAAQTPDAAFNALKEEMIASFVGLFDCRAYCSVQVCFSADTAVTRAELTDQQLFISWYHAPSGAGQHFPQTFGFAPGSLMFQMHMLDLVRRVDIADSLVRMDPQLTDDDFRTTLSHTFGKTFSQADLDTYRAQYWKSMEPFLSLLQAS